jgi:hypothetical protein
MSLSVENDKVVKKIQKNEFNLIEHKAIVLSYEQNIRKKEEILIMKEKQLEETVSRCESLNSQIAEQLERILSYIKRNRGRSDIIGEV